MRINFSNQAINNFQNNVLKNVHLTNTKYDYNADNNNADNNNFSATLNITNQSINKYFDEGIFSSQTTPSFADIQSDLGSVHFIYSHDKYSTNDVVKEFGEKYAEVYEKIMSHAPEEKKKEYMAKLDAAFEEAVETESNKMFCKVNKMFENNNIESPLDKDLVKKIFNEVAYAVKDYYLENSSFDLNTYINSKVNFSNKQDFKTYDAFSTVMDIVDLTDHITNKMKKLKDLLLSNSPDDIIQSSDLFKNIQLYTQLLNKDVEKLNDLKKSLNEEELGDSFRKDFMKVIDKETTGLNDMNSKMQRYAEYLEKYGEIQKEVKKANAKRDALNAKLNKTNEDKNQDLIGMYLKRVASADSEIAKLRAQSAEIEAEMANLLKEIKEINI